MLMEVRGREGGRKKKGRRGCKKGGRKERGEGKNGGGEREGREGRRRKGIGEEGEREGGNGGVMLFTKEHFSFQNRRRVFQAERFQGLSFHKHEKVIHGDSKVPELMASPPQVGDALRTWTMQPHGKGEEEQSFFQFFGEKKSESPQNLLEVLTKPL